MEWMELLKGLTLAIIPSITILLAYLINYYLKRYSTNKNDKGLNLEQLVNDIIDAELTLGAKQGKAKLEYVLSRTKGKPKKLTPIIENTLTILKNAEKKINNLPDETRLKNYEKELLKDIKKENSTNEPL